jgi:acyl-CoA synthetase (AMP-forming)/AMP-acid ligase II
MTTGWAAKQDRVLPRLLRRQARDRPDAEFLRVEDGPVQTFAEVAAASDRIAGVLARLGVRPGDMVPLLVETSAAAIAAWFAVNIAGAADVPLNTAYRGASLAHGINLPGARLLIANPAFLPRIAEVAAELTTLETVLLLDDDQANEGDPPSGRRHLGDDRGDLRDYAALRRGAAPRLLRPAPRRPARGRDRRPGDRRAGAGRAGR